MYLEDLFGQVDDQGTKGRYLSGHAEFLDEISAGK